MTIEKNQVTWATNLAAPYRIPVWREMATRCDLRVLLFADSEHNRTWTVPSTPEPFEHTRLPTWKQRIGEDTYYIARRPPAHRPDVIILPAWNQPASWQLLHWAKKQRVATVAFNESTIQSHRYHRGPLDIVRRRFYQLVDRVLTVSPASTAAVMAAGVRPDKVDESINAVDAELFEAARINGSAGPPHVFVFCGQFIPRKRPDLVLQALSHLKDDSSHLIMIGKGPLDQELRLLAAKFGVNDRVTFTGHLDSAGVADIFSRTHTLVMPSSQEVHGLVAAEALTAGMHIVVSADAGVTSIVRGNPGVFVIEPTLDSAVQAMESSSHAWHGRMDHPTLTELGHPEQMAAIAVDAASRAIRHH